MDAVHSKEETTRLRTQIGDLRSKLSDLENKVSDCDAHLFQTLSSLQLTQLFPVL